MKFAALKRFRYHALVLLGVIVAYVAADVWWHRTGQMYARTHSPPADPFAVSPGYQPPFSDKLIRAANRAFFFDFASHYANWTSPFRFRKDRRGILYFDSENPFIESYFAGGLRCMDELSLESPTPPETPILRLTVSPALSNPFALSVYSNESDANFSVRKVTISAFTGEVTEETRYELNQQQWSQLQNLQDTESFWDSVSEDELFSMRGHDGAYWLFETNREGNHETVILWSPNNFVDQAPEGSEHRNFKAYVEAFEILQKATEGPTISPFGD